MTTDKGKDIIESGWRVAGILDALKLGLEKLPSIDSIGDIAPKLNDDDQSDEIKLLALCDITAEEFLAFSGPANDDESDGDSEREEDIESESDN